MSQAEERRRLFEDETGRNFGQHAGETSLSFESFADRRRRERSLEPQQYPAGDVYAAGGAERQRKVAGRRPPGMRRNVRTPSHRPLTLITHESIEI
jgi:hypothetical protein